MSAALWAGDASVALAEQMAMTAARSVWVNLAGTGIIALQQRFADCTGGVCTGLVFWLCYGWLCVETCSTRRASQIYDLASGAGKEKQKNSRMPTASLHGNHMHGGTGSQSLTVRLSNLSV